MKGVRGTDRGSCNSDECNEFVGKVWCDYCDCAATTHARLSEAQPGEQSNPMKRLKVSDENDSAAINCGTNDSSSKHVSVKTL